LKKYKRRFDEGIKIDNDKITFDYSDNEGVNISLNKMKNFIAHSKSQKGKIISLYSITTENKQILRALKNEGNLKIDVDDLKYFALRSAMFAYHNIKNKNIDYIIYNENTYPFLDIFINILSKKFSSKVLKVNNDVFKTGTENIQLKKDIPDSLKTELNKILLNLRKKKSIKLRNDIIPRYRKFFTGFLDISSSLKEKIEGKSVLYIDDIFTTGSTFKEVFSILENANVSDIQGLSIFKFK